MTPKSGWLSSEFWLAAAAMAGKIVTFLYAANLLRNGDPAQVAQQVSIIVGGIGTIIAITHGSNTYVESRKQLKAQAMAMAATRVVDMRTPPRRPGVG